MLPIPGTGLRLHGVQMSRLHPSPLTAPKALDCSVSEPQAGTPDTLLGGGSKSISPMYQAAAGTERASKGDAPFPEKRLFPQRSVFCSRAETDPAQGAQGPWGKQPRLLQEEPLSPPATHLMWKFWMLTFL